MDVRRFLDLYIAEARDHLGLLQRSLLALEHDRTGGALDEAFRAAHTLKGISAAMGYGGVATAAHALEDRLAGLRSGGGRAAAPLVDELLRRTDELAVAVDAATTGTPGEPAAPAPADRSESVAAAPAPSPPVVVPAGTAAVVHVTLERDAPIKAARAMLIMKALESRRGLIGSEPSAFSEDFSGSLHIFFGASAELDGVEAAIRGAGDVASVELLPVAAEAAARPAAAVPAGGVRHVRVEAGMLDVLAEGVGEAAMLVAGLREQSPLAGDTRDVLDRLGVLLGTLQQDVMQLRMVPLRDAFERLPRVVRDAARLVGKDVDLSVSGGDVQLDRAIVEEIGEPLVHLLRNAVDHGIEAGAEREGCGKGRRGRIQVSASRERSSVRIVVADDGGGVPAARVVDRARAAGLPVPDDAGALTGDQLLGLLSHPGLTTAEAVSAVSGRGVGLDVVVSRIRALGGALDMQTQPGQGTTFSIRLPVTLALAPVLRVRVGDEQYFIPLTHVTEALDLQGAIAPDDTVRVRGESIALVRLGRVLGAEGGTSEDTAIIAGSGERRVALGIDELIGREQVLLKSFVPAPGLLPHFTGAAFLPSGRPALVLDPLSLTGGQ